MTNTSSTRRASAPWSIVAWIVLLAAFAGYGVLLARHVETYAGGSDSSGYLNHARLLAAGHLHVPIREVAELKPAHPRPWMYTALGFRPSADGDGLVPTYPTGLPLLLAAGARLVGWDRAGNVVLWLHAMAGVLLTYAMARMAGLSPRWAIPAAVIVAASPLYLFFSVTLMSDVPALVWATAALLLAWRSARRPRWAWAAGAAFAVGVLIRPTNVLMLVPITFTLGRDRQRWVRFLAGGIPGACFLVLHTHAAYGSFFTSGYGDSAQLEAVWLAPTLRHYGHWLPILFTPVVVLFFGLPFLFRPSRQSVLVLGSWFLIFAGFYAAYEFTHQTWWFLRFLLPAAPALVIGALLVTRKIFDERSPSWVGIVTLGLACVVAVRFEAHWTEKLSALDSGKGERVYPAMTHWLNDNLPANSVLAVMQTSGAVVYGTHFEFVRWDWLYPDNFTVLTNGLRNSHRPLYAVLFPHEISELNAFKEHMPIGTWVKIGNVEQVTIWRWAPASSKT